LKNYENRLKAIQRIADGKSAKIAFLDYRNGKYYQDGKQVDINTVKANVIIIDDIPDTPPEFLEKGDDMKNESDG
jgi:phosphoribosylpyrophosphate synthetase